MGHDSMKAKLLDITQRAYDDELAFVSALSDEERVAVGLPARWSAKDLIVHIGSWKQRMTLILEAAARGEIPPTFDDEDVLNAQTFEANRDRSWSEVLADAERIITALMARVREFDEEVLTNPDYFTWRQGRPLWQPIAANAFAHSQAHLAEWHLKRGDLARATQMQERLAAVRRSLDDSPRNHGIASYNLACFYATSGQHEKALSLLSEALRLNPDLVEWSKQDTDLESLRNHPTFQSLYQSA
jgi:tetratricopeptide (TPR) repeat protein